jgi:CBS domain-containing protein
MSTHCPSCGTKNLEGADECAFCGGDLRAVDVSPQRDEPEPSAMHLPLTALDLTAAHTVSPHAPLAEAVQMLVREHVDIVEVVENDQLIGVLSVRDIMTRVGIDYAANISRPVSEFMTRRVETLPPDAPITFGINKMDVGGYRHVPIVQDGRVIGVASALDVMSYLLKSSSDDAEREQGISPSFDIDPPAAFAP